MAIRRKRESRDQRRFTRRSTKRGFVFRPPAHPWRIVSGVLTVVIVVALALVWGSHLKAESDAFRAAQERGEWTLEADQSIHAPVAIPEVRAVSIKPMGNVGDIIIAGDHDGVIMTLNSAEGTLFYVSRIGDQAGLTTETDAPSLTDDVNRVSKRDLRVTCAFTVTCFGAENTAEYTYLRGLELALLREYAEAGMDDILLFGLPAGSETEDILAMEFLRDLREALSDLQNQPAIGVALTLDHFTTEEHAIPLIQEPAEEDSSEMTALPSVNLSDGTPPHYVGDRTPPRLLSMCDYLAADLRGLTPREVDAVLPHLPYAYTRYALCLLVDKSDPAVAEDILSHGFARVMEMDP